MQKTPNELNMNRRKIIQEIFFEPYMGSMIMRGAVVIGKIENWNNGIME